MKKLTILIAILSLAMFSQNSFAQIKIGGKAGLNIANANMSGISPKAKIGFHLGAVGEYEIMDALMHKVDCYFLLEVIMQPY